MSLVALTLWQPWAYCITDLGKRVENRPWMPPAQVLGKYIALHAGRTYDHDGERWIRETFGVLLEQEPRAHLRGCIIGVARVKTWLRDVDADDGPAPGADLFHGDDWERSTRAHPTKLEALPAGQEKWFFGPFGWVLDDVVAFEPVPCRGYQKLWPLSADV